jgi:two-component system, NarL family, nitrate/nitrite response regulator NarL
MFTLHQTPATTDRATAHDPDTVPMPHAAAPALAARPRPLRVLVADDHPLYRQGIVRALESTGAFEVTHQASDGATALELIRRHEPDVAVLDLRMPGMDGIDVTAALARYGPAVPVVLLSAFDDEPLVAAGLEAGAAAYVSKTADRDAICLDVAAAARAQAARSPRAIHGAADLGRDRPRGWTPRLTSKEHGLLQLAHAGWEKPELAFLTGVDEPTLRRRLDSILAKLGADDLAEAIRIARARNIVR